MPFLTRGRGAKLLCAVLLAAAAIICYEYRWVFTVDWLDPSLAIVHTVSLHAAAALVNRKCIDVALQTRVNSKSAVSWTVHAWPLSLDEDDLRPATWWHARVGPLHSLAISALDAELVPWAELLAAIGVLNEFGGVFLSQTLTTCPPYLAALHHILHGHRGKCIVPVSGSTAQPLLLMCWRGAAGPLVAALQHLTQADMERESPAAWLVRFMQREGERGGLVGLERARVDWLPPPFVPAAAPLVDTLGEVKRVRGCVDIGSVGTHLQTAVFPATFLPAFQSQLTSDERLLLHVFIDTAIKACQDLGIEVATYGGSLIGAARHSAVIPWDDDYDLVCWNPDVWQVLERAADQLADRGIGIARFGRTGKTQKLFATEQFMPQLARRSTTKYAWRWPFVDLFLCDSNDLNGTLTCQDDLSMIHVSHRSIFPLRLAYLNGKSVPVPRSIDAFNFPFYGRDWASVCYANGYFHPGETVVARPAWAKGQTSIECEQLAHFVPLTRRLPIDDPLAVRVIGDAIRLAAERHVVSEAAARAKMHGVSVLAKDVCGTLAHVSAFVEFDALDTQATNTTHCDALAMLQFHSSDDLGLLDDAPDRKEPETKLVGFQCTDVAHMPMRSVPPHSVFPVLFSASKCLNARETAHKPVVSLRAEAEERRSPVCAQECLARGVAAYALTGVNDTTCSCVDLTLAPRASALTDVVQCRARNGLVVYRSVSFERGRDAVHRGALHIPDAANVTFMPLKTGADLGCAYDNHEFASVDDLAVPLEPAIAEQLYGGSASTRCAFRCAQRQALFAFVRRAECRCGSTRVTAACDHPDRLHAYVAAPPAYLLVSPTVPRVAAALVGTNELAACVVAHTNATLPEAPYAHISHADCLVSCLHNGVVRAIAAQRRCWCVPPSALPQLRLCDDQQRAGDGLRGVLLEVKLLFKPDGD